MRKTLLLAQSWLSALCFAFTFCTAAPAMAQQQDFSPHRGVCWGIFYDQTGENLLNYLIPVTYDHPQWDKIILRDFVNCGKDLVINITDVNDNPEYYDVSIAMDEGMYDEVGYFYYPFTAGEYKYSVEAPNGEVMGPIYQPGSYYHQPLEYVGLFYVRYTRSTEFAYFDIKTQEDYYEDKPREYYDPDEEDSSEGISPLPAAEPIDFTYYNLQGRIARAAERGILINNGRKVLK